MDVALRRKGALTVVQVHSLIDNVRSFPCIWNPEHEDYIHRSKVASAWADIAIQVELPEDLIRAKWKNLRDLFMREAKRTKVTAIDEYNGKWRHFKDLWFLFRVESNERGLSDDESADFLDPPEPCVIKTERPDAVVTDFVFLDTERELSASLPEDQTLRNLETGRDNVSDIFAETPKRRRANEAYTEDDCDMMFLKSLTPYLKLLKPTRRLVVRNKIQDIILQEIERCSLNGQV